MAESHGNAARHWPTLSKTFVCSKSLNRRAGRRKPVVPLASRHDSRRQPWELQIPSRYRRALTRATRRGLKTNSITPRLPTLTFLNQDGPRSAPLWCRPSVVLSGTDSCGIGQNTPDFDFGDHVAAFDAQNFDYFPNTNLLKLWAEKAHARGIPY